MRSLPFAALLVVLLSQALARAQSAPPDGAIPEEDVSYSWARLAPPFAGGRFFAGAHADLGASAEGTAGGARAATDLTVGAEAGVSGACSYLDTGGELGLHAGADGTEVSATHWLSSCLLSATGRGAVAPALTVSHRLDWDVRPALSAPRLIARRRYRAETVRVDGGFLVGQDSVSDIRTILFPFSVEVDRLWQDDVAGGAGRSRITVESGIGGCGPTGRRCIGFGGVDSFTLLLMRFAWNPGPRQVLTGSLVIARAAGVHLADHLTADAEADFAFGQVSGDSGQVGAANRYQPLASVTTFAGHIELAVPGSAATVRLRYARDVVPSFDQEIVLEDRLTTSVELHRGLPGLELLGYLAGTQVGSATALTHDLTYGAQVRDGWRLARGLDLGVVGEIGRSYYASIDGATDPTPAPVARVLVVLSGHVGRGK